MQFGVRAVAEVYGSGGGGVGVSRGEAGSGSRNPFEVILDAIREY